MQYGIMLANFNPEGTMDLASMDKLGRKFYKVDLNRKDDG